MSLHKFADMVAKQGRGEDSLLIHMTPDEVQRLQKFAEANGRSLTINPETGLPEAGMLSDLFKAVAPIALGAFLGPAGAAFGGGLMSAGMAGLTVGGITTLATGSLSRGLMAGLGAYGGAGLGESLMGAGTGALEAGAASAAQGQLGAAQLALGEALPEQAAAQFTKDAAARQLASATPWDKMSAGLGSITSSPSAAGTFAKDNWKSLAAAASPIMAGAMVPTTTKMPENNSPAYIRQKLYDPYTQTYKTLAPVKASEWGSRSFSDAYTNPQTGEMATLQPRAPSGFADGGIVALANGGTLKMAGGTPPEMLTDEQLYQKTGSWEAAAAARDAQNNALNQYNWAQQAAAQQPVVSTPVAAAVPAHSFGDSVHSIVTGQDYATPTPVNYDKVATDYVKTAAIPTGTASQFVSGAEKAGVGLTAPLQLALANSGLSAAAQYALTHSDIGMKENTAENYGGLAGLSSNINYGVNTLRGTGATGAEARAAALAEMNRYGINEADVLRATGKTLAELFPDQIKKVTQVLTGTGTGTSTTTTPTRVTDTVLPTNPTVNAPPGTRNPYGNVNNPGDLTFNNDGSITVQPNIPGRPYGGFSGMDEVKNAYTAGGGSLGYTPKAPQTIDEFNQMFNRQTGDSMAAYEYLMGKAGAKYPVQSVAASGAQGIMRPYWSAGMKYKPKFLSYDKEGKIVSNDGTGASPNAGASGDLTKAQTIEVVDSSGESTQTYTAVLQKDGTYLAGNGKRYDVTGKELAAYGGLMGYADGGVTGNGNLNLNIPLNVGGAHSGPGGFGGVGSTGVTGSTGGSMNPNTGTGGTSAVSSYPGFSSQVPGDLAMGDHLLKPQVSYSPFSEEGRIAYEAAISKPGRVVASGPMPGNDYATANGLDDTMTPGMMAENAANQQRNAALRASSAGSTSDMTALARRLGIGMANGGMTGYAVGGGLGSLGSYSDGGRLLKGPGDGVSDSIPATIGAKRQPARLADGEFVIPARIVSELGNGSTEAGAKKLYAMMDRVQKARGKTTGKNKVAANSRADKHLPA